MYQSSHFGYNIPINLFAHLLTYINLWKIIREIVVLTSDPPGPPSAPVVKNVCKDSCELTWHPPDNDGGSPVTGYHVERRDSGRSDRWIHTTLQPVPDTRYKVTELVEGNEYQFRILAENSVAVGQPGPESDRVLAKDQDQRG